MRAFFFLCTFLMTIGVHAQGSISGNFEPAKDFKWIIAYELTPSGEKYVTDSGIKDGFFNLKMPITAQPGVYRLVYAVPQDEFYIDIIYNKKEDVEFNFNLQEGVTITSSEVNKGYNDYFRKIAIAEDKLMECYESGETSREEYESIINELRHIQQSYEEKYAGTMAHQFIAANKPYLPEDYETLNEFLNHKKQHHFDYLDVNNTVLQSSNFLTDKIANYVFSALPKNIKTKGQLAEEINKNVKTATEVISQTPESFQIKVLEQLWNIANINAIDQVEDYIFNNHLKQLAIANGNQKIVNDIESISRLRIGTVSPEIVWEANGKKHSLSTMEKAESYLIVFWSSTCSHCLNELPALHKELSTFNTVKVLAVGLEDGEINWKKVAATLPKFEHAIALGKWESDYAKTFNIQKTPSYFILDSEKRFVAKPDNDKEVIEFLED